MYQKEAIGVATTTFYPKWQPLREGERRTADDVDGVRGDAALKTIRKATRTGFTLGVVDSPKSSTAFKDALSHLSNEKNIFVYTEKAGSTMSAGRRQVIGEVSNLPGVKIVGWTEPEKESMVDNLEKAAEPLWRDEADIVVPKRDEAAFATYPDYQVVWEKSANEQFNSLLKEHGLLPQEAEELDAWIGPRLIKNDPDVIRLFLHPWELDQTAPEKRDPKLDPELWPNGIFLPLVASLQRDKLLNRPPRVKSVPINYRHPAEQTRIEKDSDALRAKREQQFTNIIGATEALIQVFEYDAQHGGLYRPR